MKRGLELIVEAISNRQILEFVYPPGRRLIEPYALGYSADMNLLLRAYQTEGASASGEHEHWKLFRLDRAERIDPTGSSFTDARAEYKRGDRAMKGGIIAEL
jgi:hypothetical protein